MDKQLSNKKLDNFLKRRQRNRWRKFFSFLSDIFAFLGTFCRRIMKKNPKNYGHCKALFTLHFVQNRRISLTSLAAVAASAAKYTMRENWFYLDGVRGESFFHTAVAAPSKSGERKSFHKKSSLKCPPLEIIFCQETSKLSKCRHLSLITLITEPLLSICSLTSLALSTSFSQFTCLSPSILLYLLFKAVFLV